MTTPKPKILKGLLLKGLLLGSVVLLTLGVLAPSVHGASADTGSECTPPASSPSNVRISVDAAAMVAGPRAYGGKMEDPAEGEGALNDQGGAAQWLVVAQTQGDCLRACQVDCRDQQRQCAVGCAPGPESGACRQFCADLGASCHAGCISSCSQ